MEVECTCEYFLSGGDLLHGGVVGATSSRCWACLLIHHGCHDSWRVALFDSMIVLGYVAGLPTVETQVSGGCRLLWWSE
jgi:hypothetical protein